MIQIVSKSYCGYCHAAKKLLEQLGIDYNEIDVTQDNETFQKMNEISGMRTVPQIFVGEITKENLIGGFDDISVLHRENKLLHIMK